MSVYKLEWEQVSRRVEEEEEEEEEEEDSGNSSTVQTEEIHWSTDTLNIVTNPTQHTHADHTLIWVVNYNDFICFTKCFLIQ